MRYPEELFAQRTPYLQWLRAQGKNDCNQCGKHIQRLPFSSCMDSAEAVEHMRDGIIIFVKDGGSESEDAAAFFSGVFEENPDAVLAYADEDYRAGLLELYGIGEDEFPDSVTSPYRLARTGDFRGAPWFKPDFSPDTLASFFYIGSIFAVRRDAVLGVMEKYGRGISIYEMVYRIFTRALSESAGGMRQNMVVHIPKVLYTNDSLGESARIDCSVRIRELYASYGVAGGKISDKTADKISIVIPSKDNAEVLGKCLSTLTRYTEYDNYEIIVVDNGSCREQRLRAEGILDALRREKAGLAVKYVYEKIEFNFSAMCNMGAAAADGGYLLFLNDDIEVTDAENGGRWLEKMMFYAAKSHVGAVGIKLYYPEIDKNGCNIIQHAGITNMGIGPAHKLCGLADEGCIYHGRNTVNYDMLAVTAACMLVRREVFDEAGGFDESFPVAYNDVEFCFRLHEKGYFNVQVNDAVLLHHESLSRGNDTAPENAARLAGEMRRLYEKHPALRANDPFYSPNLVQWKKDAEYNAEYLYVCDHPVKPVLLGDGGEEGRRKRGLLKKYAFRDVLRANGGMAAKIYDRLTGYNNLMMNIDNITYDILNGKPCITIQGWCVVRNVDNAGLQRKLWLVGGTRGESCGRVYELEIMPKLREDVAEVFGDTKNTALAGIHAVFDKGVPEPGTYRVGVVVQNKLVCDLEKQVEIEGDCNI